MLTDEEAKKDPVLGPIWRKLDSLTTPDKHDMLVAKFGNRVRIIETAQGKIRDEAIAGETSLRVFEHVIKTLPSETKLGLVQIILGNDFQSCDFVNFITEYSKLKKFNVAVVLGTQTTKQVFENMLKIPMDNTAGTA